MTEPSCKVKAEPVGADAPPAWGSRGTRSTGSGLTMRLRVQMRIAKAVKVGRWNKVQDLQRLLTRSISGKLLAVKRVKENPGKRTSGVDGKIYSTPMSKMKASQALTNWGPQPLSLRRNIFRKAMERSAH